MLSFARLLSPKVHSSSWGPAARALNGTQDLIEIYAGTGSPVYGSATSRRFFKENKSCEISASTCAQLAEDPMHVVFDSRYTQREGHCDLFVRHAFAKQFVDFPLPFRQGVSGGGHDRIQCRLAEVLEQDARQRRRAVRESANRMNHSGNEILQRRVLGDATGDAGTRPNCKFAFRRADSDDHDINSGKGNKPTSGERPSRKTLLKDDHSGTVFPKGEGEVAKLAGTSNLHCAGFPQNGSDCLSNHSRFRGGDTLDLTTASRTSGRPLDFRACRSDPQLRTAPQRPLEYTEDNIESHQSSAGAGCFHGGSGVGRVDFTLEGNEDVRCRMCPRAMTSLDRETRAC